MKWKNLKLKYKLFIGFGTIVFFLLFVALLSIFGAQKIIQNGKEVIAGNQIKRNIAERELEHVKWVNKLSEFLYNDDVTSLNIETDYHKCKFGQFYYGQMRRNTEKFIPELKPVLEKIEEPHKQLHESAIEISKVFKQIDRDLLIHFEEAEIEILKLLEAIEEDLNNNQSGNIAANTEQCKLSGIISDARVSKLLRNNPEIRVYFEKIKDLHEAFHKKLTQIGLLISSGNYTKANNFYHTSVLKNAESLLSNLDAIRKIGHEKSEKMQIAYGIYNQKTMPALNTLSVLFRQINKIINNQVMTDEGMIAEAKRMQIELITISVFIAVIAFFNSLLVK